MLGALISGMSKMELNLSSQALGPLDRAELCKLVLGWHYGQVNFQQCEISGSKDM